MFNPDPTGPIRYVQNFNKSIGGAESNVAIALARLGHSVGWFSRLGNDDLERYIKNSKNTSYYRYYTCSSKYCRDTVFKTIKVAKENKVFVSFDPIFRGVLDWECCWSHGNYDKR